MSDFESIKAREEKLLCRTYGRYPVAVIRGKGSRLWDEKGKEYVDLLAGIAVTALGHANEELAEVIAAHARKLIHVSNLFYQEEQLDFAEKLLATCHLDKVFCCNSGAEANEAAIKIARRYAQRVQNREAFEVLTLTGAFHGRTLAAVAATGPAFQDGFAPIPQGFRQIPWGDLAALEAAISPQTAAVLVEIVQGESGIRPMSPEYARGIEALCRKHNILFMTDEVQAGMFRSGKPWAYQHFDLHPDVVTSSKCLANGLPLGAMMCSDEVARAFVTGSHASTFGGGALLTAVGSKVLEIMQRDRLDLRSAELGARALARFRDLAALHPAAIKEVRGLGLLLGIELSLSPEDCKKVWLNLLDQGFILNLSHGKTLRLLPALNIDEEDLIKFTAALEKSLRSV